MYGMFLGWMSLSVLRFADCLRKGFGSSGLGEGITLRAHCVCGGPGIGPIAPLLLLYAR